jgi:glutathione S-transferase
MATPILWQFAISHYAEKVRWGLDLKRVPHIRHSLFPGPHLGRIKPMTGQTAVPVLELDGKILVDSTRILEALDSAFPEPRIYPASSAQHERAVALERFLDEELGVDLRQWFYFMLLPHTATITAMFAGHSTRPQRLLLRAMFPAVRPLMKRSMKIYPIEAAAARERAIAAMDRIARELEPSGYLVGDRFSAADLTAAALLSPLLMPKEAPYEWPAHLPANFAGARKELSAHPVFKWAQEIYARHRGASCALLQETVI